MQVYLWFLEFPNAEWEGEPSVIRLMSHGAGSQFVFKSTDIFPPVKIKLQTFLFDKDYLGLAQVTLDFNGMSNFI